MQRYLDMRSGNGLVFTQQRRVRIYYSRKSFDAQSHKTLATEPHPTQLFTCLPHKLAKQKHQQITIYI